MKPGDVLADDPLWLTVAKVVAVFALLMVMTLFMIDRKSVV